MTSPKSTKTRYGEALDMAFALQLPVPRVDRCTENGSEIIVISFGMPPNRREIEFLEQTDKVEIAATLMTVARSIR